MLCCQGENMLQTWSSSQEFYIEDFISPNFLACELFASATVNGSLTVFYVFLTHTDNVKRTGRNVQRSSLHHELACRLCEGKITYLKLTSTADFSIVE